METFYLCCVPRFPQKSGRNDCTGQSFLMWDPFIIFSSPPFLQLVFHQKWEKTINTTTLKPRQLKLMWQKHVVITLIPYHRRIKSHLVLHLLDSCSIWHPRSCFPELYDSVYKYFICTINIVPVYDVSFGQVLILDRQESTEPELVLAHPSFSPFTLEYLLHLGCSGPVIQSVFIGSKDLLSIKRRERFFSSLFSGPFFFCCLIPPHPTTTTHSHNPPPPPVQPCTVEMMYSPGSSEFLCLPVDSLHTFECLICLRGFNQPSLWNAASARPLCDITRCTCQPHANRRAGGGRQLWMGTCLSVFARRRRKARRMVPLHNTHFDRHIGMFVGRSVNVADRCQLLCQGWGYTFPPQQSCLQRFASTPTTDRIKTFYFSAHTCGKRRAHTQPPGYH